MSSLDSLDSALYASTFFSSAGAAGVDGAGPPPGAGPLAPSLQLRLPQCSHWPKALKTILAINIYMGCFNEDIDLILCDHHLIVLQNEGWVDAGLLRDRGHGAGECSVGLLAQCQSPDEVRASPQNGLGFLRRTEHLSGHGRKGSLSFFGCTAWNARS